jgi:hypothetical protein
LSAPQRTARIENDIWNPAQARAQAEGASLAALLRAAVQRDATGGLASHPGPELTGQAAPSITATGLGDPSPGTLCMGLGCFQRDTRQRKIPTERGTPHAPLRSLIL